MTVRDGDRPGRPVARQVGRSSGSGWSVPSGWGSGEGARSGAGWSAADSAPPADGHGADRFGVAEQERYQECGLLGRGGMGEVHAALDQRLGRVVARKRVAQRLHGAVARARLAREAALTARLDHPGIVQVYDAGVDSAGEPFYTMRLVAGRTLADAIAQGPEPAERMRLLRHVHAAVQAVAYAHDQGIVHRDLKPENLLIGEFGETQVVDWGLACEGTETVQGVAAHGAPPQPDGGTVGTPGYVCPAAAKGGGFSPRSDVFGLGVVLAEVALGRRLTTGAPGEAAAPSDLTRIDPQVPAELVAIVARATAQDPAARYADAGALAADIEAFLDGRAVGAYRYSAWEQVRRLARAWRVPLLAGAGTVLVLAAGLATAWHRTGAERDRALEAEGRAQVALARADAGLGRALLESARTAAAEFRLPEAEVLAAHALRLGGHAEARGILLRARVQSIRQAGPPVPLPAPCVRRVFDATGSLMLCLETQAVALHELRPDGPARLRWRVPRRAEDGALTAHGVLLTRGVEDDVLLDPDTGALRQAIRLEYGRGEWARSASLRGAVRSAVDGYARVDAATATVVSIRTCGGHHTVAVALAPDGGPLAQAVAAVCQTGRVELYSAQGSLLSSFETGLGVAHRTAAAAWWSGDGDRLFLGTHDGTLGAFALADGRRLFAARTDVGQVHALVGLGHLLAVTGERGGVEVWNATTGVLLARLPAAAGRAVALQPDGEIRTFGETMTRWRLPDSPRALRLPGGEHAHGLASAALAPDGTRLALARADGTLLVVDTHDGAVVVEDPVANAVVKFAAWNADGSALAAVASVPPGLVEYAAASGWTRQQGLAQAGHRRVVQLRSGARVLMPYGAGLDVLPPPGRSPGPRYEPADSGEPTPAFRDLATTPDLRGGVAVDSRGGLHWFDDCEPVAFRSIARLAGVEVADRSASSRLVAAGAPGRVTLLTPAGAVVRSVATSGGRIHDIAWSPDDRLLAVAENAGSTRLYYADTLTEAAILVAHRRRVSAVSFDAASRWLVTAGWDGSALLWDLDGLSRSPATLLAEAEAKWGIRLPDVLDGPPISPPDPSR